MAKKPIQLIIPTPCQQRWQDMEADPSGRFCAHCQKTVTDFSGLTDQQIADVLAQNLGSGCGRFRLSQLNRPLLPTTATIHSPNRFFGLMTVGLLGYQAAQAEVPPNLALPIATHTATFPIADVPQSPTDEVVVTDSVRLLAGRVIDGTDSVGLPGVNIYIPELAKGVHTDSLGNFQLSIPAERSRESLVVHVAFVGYVTQEIRLSPDQNKPLAITLLEDTVALGEVVCVGGYRKLTFWERLRNRFRSRH